MSVNLKPRRIKGQRPTIGLLIDSTVQGYEQAVWQGVVEQTKISDVNLVTFNVASQNVEGADRELSQIIELINGNNIQGLILASTTILDIISMETINEFFAGFHPMPMVSIGVDVEGIPSLIVDNYIGMRKAIDHLIEDHGYQRIAFMQMFGNNPEAEERFRGYTKSLADHNIPFDLDLVVPGKYFGKADEAVSLLLTDRNVKFDAFVAVNDDMATKIMDSLQSRGYRIPSDIAIVGFDDHEISRFLSPPLTTTRQPLNLLGKQSVKLLLTKIDDGEIPDTVVLQTELIVRQSCGCIHPDVTQAIIFDSNDDKFSGIPGLLSSKNEIIQEILGDFQSSEHHFQLISEVIEALIKTIAQQSSELFIQQLSQKAEDFTNTNDGVFNWHSVISILRRHTLNTLPENVSRPFAENLFQQARTLVSDVTQRKQASLRLKAIREANLFRNFSQRLTTPKDQKSLLDMLTRELPIIGIPSCLLAVNEQLQPSAKQKQLLLVFNPEIRYPLPIHGIHLNPGDFPQEKFFPVERQYSFIVENINFQNQSCGFIMLETDSADGSLFRGLAIQISSALENVILVEQVEARANKLATAAEISRAANNILEPEELIQKTVNLVQDRFNLYYAGLFLVDESGLWAKLRAGTGESGANMMTDNWRLEAGGSSMVGRCITTGEADIQLDVDNAPVHLRNPHLPNTKSEMALPLISRGTILGALTIQSETPNAFSNEDIVNLQTMADQVATSIANAQLFEQTQTALLDTETLLNVSRLAGTSTELDIYIQQVLDLALKSTGISNGIISIYNNQTNRLEIAAHYIPDSFLTTLQTNSLEGTLCDLVFQQRKSIIISNLAEDSNIEATGLISLGFNSYQGVPLETKGKFFGTLCTFSKSILTPDDTRIALLQAIGQQVAVTIENTLLIKQTQDALADTEMQSQRLAALNALSEKLTHTETVESILQAGSSVISHIIKADHNCYVRVKENNQNAEIISISAEGSLVPTGTIVNIENGHIGVAIRSKNTVVVADSTQTIPIQDERLSKLGLRSFLVVPLVVSNQTIGAFEFGNNESNGFSEQDRDLMVQFSSVLGNAIDNKNLLQQTQDTLGELEATQRRYQLQVWSTYNKNRRSSGYRQTVNSIELLGQEKISEIERALQKQAPVVSDDEKNLTLTIPIMLRDQPIGAIGLQGDQEKRQWTTDEITFVQEISDQFALAAESLRLLDETQQRAARERLVAEITTKIRASNDPQTMIQTAAQELNEALQTIRTQITFQQNEKLRTRGEE